LRLSFTVKLGIVFLVSYSMIIMLPGPLSHNNFFPTLGIAHANLAPVQAWYPAGPAMDTLQDIIYTNEQAEWSDIQTSQNIDLTDYPLPPGLGQEFLSNSSYLVTPSIPLHIYYDFEFMLANNFWGCAFNYGNSQCGIEIRQGIAHMIDKANFVKNDASVGTTGAAIDDPESSDNLGLPSANPCAWDVSFPQSGTQCIVGGRGGTAYHLANATGNGPYSWLPAPGSPDLNAAAQHFVNAGIATGYNHVTSVLTGVSPAATSNGAVPNYVIQNSHPPILDYGNSLAAEICYLFTGSLGAPCTYMTTTPGNEVAFPGYQTSPSIVNLSWHMFTGAFASTYPYDMSLYGIYNSRFVSGIPSIKSPNGLCSSISTPSYTAPDYMYLCNSNFDTSSSKMEYASCLHANGEPVVGSTSNNPDSTNGGAQCAGAPSGNLSAVAYGVQSEDLFGKGEYSIPIFTTTQGREVYLNNGWTRVINGSGQGVPNFFTWLNAYNPNPSQPGTIRQGFQRTSTTDPYDVSVNQNLWDWNIVRNIYDSLMIEEPNSTDLLNWMIISEQQLAISQLTYTPPAGTSTTYRFTLRPDLFFQDGRSVTSFDVAYSYLSLLGSGSYQSNFLSSMTGITLLGPKQFDIAVSNAGPTTLLLLTAATILPGRYWSNAGMSTWDSSVSLCTRNNAACYPAQYTLGNNGQTPTCSNATGFNCTFPAANMNWDPSKIVANYDPIQNHILIGSGPWQCGSGGTLGQGCTSNGLQNPGVGNSYTLTRFGKGLAPASSVPQMYFRSSGTLALWIWSGQSGDITQDFKDFSVVAACFGQSVLGTICDRYMMGIGGCGGTITQPCTIGLQQVSIINRFVGLNWVAPFNWRTNPPPGIGSFPPVLYENSVTLNPASVVGCNAAFPTGGYDC
jgi:hypothetical protein